MKVLITGVTGFLGWRSATVLAERGHDVIGLARPGAAERAAHARPRKRRSGVIGFLGHCVDELKRVQWPDRRQVGQGTAVTLGFTVLAGGYLGLLDAIWKPLIEAIL